MFWATDCRPLWHAQRPVPRRVSRINYGQTRRCLQTGSQLRSRVEITFIRLPDVHDPAFYWWRALTRPVRLGFVAYRPGRTRRGAIGLSIPSTDLDNAVLMGHGWLALRSLAASSRLHQPPMGALPFYRRPWLLGCPLRHRSQYRTSRCSLPDHSGGGLWWTRQVSLLRGTPITQMTLAASAGWIYSLTWPATSYMILSRTGLASPQLPHPPRNGIVTVRPRRPTR